MQKQSGRSSYSVSNDMSMNMIIEVGVAGLEH